MIDQLALLQLGADALQHTHLVDHRPPNLVAADISRRTLNEDQSASTHVGGYKKETLENAA